MPAILIPHGEIWRNALIEWRAIGNFQFILLETVRPLCHAIAHWNGYLEELILLCNYCKQLCPRPCSSSPPASALSVYSQLTGCFGPLFPRDIKEESPREKRGGKCHWQRLLRRGRAVALADLISRRRAQGYSIQKTWSVQGFCARLLRFSLNKTNSPSPLAKGMNKSYNRVLTVYPDWTADLLSHRQFYFPVIYPFGSEFCEYTFTNKCTVVFYQRPLRLNSIQSVGVCLKETNASFGDSQFGGLVQQQSEW